MAICEQCKGQIKWVKTDRWYCQNPDGSDHWDLCSQLKTANFLLHGKKFTKNKGKDIGLRVDPKYAVINKKGKLKTEMMLERSSKTIHGDRCKPNECDCGLPPWELCKPDCQWAIVHP